MSKKVMVGALVLTVALVGTWVEGVWNLDLVTEAVDSVTGAIAELAPELPAQAPKAGRDRMLAPNATELSEQDFMLLSRAVAYYCTGMGDECGTGVITLILRRRDEGTIANEPTVSGVLSWGSLPGQVWQFEPDILYGYGMPTSDDLVARWQDGLAGACDGYTYMTAQPRETGCTIYSEYGQPLTFYDLVAQAPAAPSE